MIQYQVMEVDKLKPHLYEIFKQQRVELNRPELPRTEETISIAAYKDGHLIGGIIAKQQFQTMEILYLAIQAEYRNLKIGTHLLEEVEQLAKEKGIISSTLTTLHFQAGAFYERHGYTKFGQLEDVPRLGDVRYFYYKKLQDLQEGTI